MVTWRAGVVAAVLATGWLIPAEAAPVLTGGVLFNATPSGAYDGSGVRWNTLGGDGLFNLYFQDAVTLAWVNSGNTVASTALNVTMSPGTFLYNIFGEPGLVPAQGSVGLNLFFNGAAAVPSISAVNVFGGVGSPSPNASPSTLQLNGSSTVAGANTLSFTQDGLIVTLNVFSWNRSGTFANVVSGFDNVPSSNGTIDFLGSVRLDVRTQSSEIPEPGSWSLVLCAGLLFLVRRRR